MPKSSNGFGSADNGIARFATYSNTLYASTWNGATGSQIWQTTNGTNWEQFNSSIGNNPNNASAISSEEFGGYLYWGIGNWADGGEIWRTDGVNLTAVITHGFGITENGVISSLAVFDNFLYAGTGNSNGVQVWRSNNGTNWSLVANGNIGGTAGKTNALEVFKGKLYLVSHSDITGLEAWRTSNGSDWEQVGSAGFGDSNNQGSFFDNATIVFKDKLYIGINNFVTGGEVWQLTPLQALFLPVVIR